MKSKNRRKRQKEADNNISIHKDDETEPVHLIPQIFRKKKLRHEKNPSQNNSG